MGFEFSHINDVEIKDWFQKKIENDGKEKSFSIDKKKRILSKLNEAVAFENFLHTKYVDKNVSLSREAKIQFRLWMR